MGAPLNNQFWKLRAKHGRDKLFASPELLKEAIDEYFKWCIENPLQFERLIKVKVDRDSEQVERHMEIKPRAFTLSGLCIYLGCSESYFRNFKTTESCTLDFLTVITYAEEVCRTQNVEYALVNEFNSNLTARLHGMVDKQEVNANIKTLGKDLAEEEYK